MILSVCAVAVLAFGAPAAASALDSSTVGAGADASGDAGSYTPDKPHDPSLAGSSIAVACIDDVPLIDYSVVLTDPAGAAASNTARLVLSGGGHTTTIALGTLTDGVVSGTVLWPGASVSGSGAANGWPGWEFSGGSWHKTDGNFAWTLGDIGAKIVVDSEIVLPLSYPPASSGCTPSEGQLAAASTSSALSSALASTGGQSAAAIGVGIGAVALLAAGTALVLRRRRV